MFSLVRTADSRMRTYTSRKIRPINTDMDISPSHFEYLIYGYYLWFT